MEGNFIQYELWKDCGNGCRFCFNRGQEDFDKKDRILEVMGLLDDPETEKFNEVGLIGGEFFGGQLEGVRDEWEKLVGKVMDMMDSGRFVKFYVTTSLLYPDLGDLFQFLDMVRGRGHLSGTLICTSYDTIGRFRNGTEELWKKNMLRIHELYPELPLHTEMILTGDLIGRLLSGEMSLDRFRKEFSTDIDFLSPNTGFGRGSKEELERDLPGFFPKRADFLRLLALFSENGEFELPRLLNRNYQSDTVYLKAYGKKYKIECRRLKMTPFPQDSVSKSGYIDSDIPMRKDVERFWRIYGR